MIATNEQAVEDIGSANRRREVNRVDLLDSLVLENRRLKDTIEQQRGALVEKDLQIKRMQEAAKALDDAVTQWKRCIRHRNQTTEWILDQAFTDGKQVKFTVDAALGGTDFIPCRHECEVPESILPGGRKVKLELLETVYEVKLI